MLKQGISLVHFVNIGNSALDFFEKCIHEHEEENFTCFLLKGIAPWILASTLVPLAGYTNRDNVESYANYAINIYLSP